MARNRHNSVFRFLAVIAIVSALAFLLLPHTHADHLAPPLVAFTAILIEVLPLVQRISSTDERDGNLLPDSPTTPASFQRPPPSLA